MSRWLLKRYKHLKFSLTSNDGLNTDTSALELHQETNAFRKRSNNGKYDSRKVFEYTCKMKIVEVFPHLVIVLS